MKHNGTANLLGGLLLYFAVMTNRYLFIGYEYAILHSDYCICKDSHINSTTPALSYNCNGQCQGNSAQYCGAANFMRVYKIGTVSINSY